MGTIVQQLKDGIPVSATALTPNDRGMPVADGTSFPFEANPRIDIKNVGEVATALGNVAGPTAMDIALGTVFSATATGAVTWSLNNPKSPGINSTVLLILTNGGVGEQTFPPSVQWQAGFKPPFTVVGTDIIVFQSSNGGASWLATLIGADFS